IAHGRPDSGRGHWWLGWGSDPRPRGYESRALPLSYPAVCPDSTVRGGPAPPLVVGSICLGWIVRRWREHPTCATLGGEASAVFILRQQALSTVAPSAGGQDVRDVIRATSRQWNAMIGLEPAGRPAIRAAVAVLLK